MEGAPRGGNTISTQGNAISTEGDPPERDLPRECDQYLVRDFYRGGPPGMRSRFLSRGTPHGKRGPE